MYRKNTRRRVNVTALLGVFLCVAVFLAVDSLHAIYGHDDKEADAFWAPRSTGTVGAHGVSSAPFSASKNRTSTFKGKKKEESRAVRRQQKVSRAYVDPLSSALTTENLVGTFDQLSYAFSFADPTSLDVPRVYIPAIPADFKHINVHTRKKLFIQMVLPIILTVNERITLDRQRLLGIMENATSRSDLNDSDRVWVTQKVQEYRLKQTDPMLSHLLARMDIIPPSLALAQAIEESGWGTSRFARLGNALYGQWTSSTRGIRHPDPIAKGWRMASFPSLFESVASYARNLNTHPAYKEFRAARLRARRADKMPSGSALVPHLHRYSERGANYTHTLRRIIRTSKLSSLDTARLSHEQQSFAFLRE